MRWLVLGVFIICGMSTAARADDQADQAYAAGQFMGAAAACGVPRDEIKELSKSVLDALGVDSSGPSPTMTKFTDGVTAGVVEQRDTPKASCDEVKEGFAQMKSKMQ